MAAGFVALMLAIAASAPATAQALFSDVSDARAADVSPSQSAAIQRIISSAATRSLSIVRVDGALLRGATANQSIEINIDSAVTLNATSKESRSLTEGRFVWKGEISGDALPNGSATIVMNGDNATGTIQTPDGRLYRLQPIGDGRNALIEVDRSKVPPDHEPGAPPMPRQKSQIETAPGGRAAEVAPETPPVIDLVVAYTTNAMNAHGDILSLIDLAIAETNESFANSGISASVRLVHTAEYSYSEAGKSFATMVGDFGGRDDGQMDSIHALRDQHGGDVAVLLIDNNAACGRAYDIGADAETAFVVVHWENCATGYYSFGHEIGHLAGARHDVARDDSTIMAALKRASANVTETQGKPAEEPH
ncbi:MAG TPA: M12 family metallo-peptidase [Hyphomicrobiaceae bacterium]|nr:M12 family metallo-peptidase [Hyphomicrobiaceae bacterium]